MLDAHSRLHCSIWDGALVRNDRLVILNMYREFGKYGLSSQPNIHSSDEHLTGKVPLLYSMDLIRGGSIVGDGWVTAR